MQFIWAAVLRRDTRQAARKQHERGRIASRDARFFCITATWRGPPVTIGFALGPQVSQRFLSLEGVRSAGRVSQATYASRGGFGRARKSVPLLAGLSNRHRADVRRDWKSRSSRCFGSSFCPTQRCYNHSMPSRRRMRIRSCGTGSSNTIAASSPYRCPRSTRLTPPWPATTVSPVTSPSQSTERTIRSS